MWETNRSIISFTGNHESWDEMLAVVKVIQKLPPTVTEARHLSPNTASLRQWKPGLVLTRKKDNKRRHLGEGEFSLSLTSKK